MRRTTAVALCTIGLASCQASKPCPNMEFGRLRQADRIDITDNINTSLRVITDKDKIAKFVAFAQSHDTDWGTPLVGTPVAMVRANFYVGAEFIGDLGVGSNFLTAQGCGYFQSRRVSREDREIIIRLFGVKDPYADR